MADTNHDLVAAARAGDQAAFDALVRDSLPKLRAVVWRLVGHAEDCEDIVQASLVRAWEGTRLSASDRPSRPG